MAVEIGALRALLSLDSAAFESGVKRAQASMGKLQRGLSKSADHMKRVGRTMTTRMSAPIVGATGLMARSSIQTAVEIERLSQVANAGAGEFQRFAAGAKDAGIEQDKLADILKDINDRVGDFAATGGGPMADFFENIAPKVGVTADQFARLSGPEALQLYVSSLEKAGASQQEMTFYMEAIASDATALLPLLRDNGKEMERLGDRAAELGAIMDENTITALNNAHDSMRDLGQAGAGLSNRLTAALAPALEYLAEKMVEVSRWFANLSPEMQRFTGIAVAVAAALGPVLLAVGFLATGLAALASPIGLVVLGLGAAIGVATAVATNWDTLVKKFPVLGEAAERTGNALSAAWEGIKAQTVALKDTVNGLLNGIIGIITGDLPGALEGFRASLTGLNDFLRETVTAWVGIFDALLPGVSEALAGVRQVVVDKFNEIMDWLREIPSRMKEIGSDMIQGLIDGIKSRTPNLGAEAAAAGRGAENAARRELETQSPSRVFMRIGQDLMAGLGLGVQQGAEAVNSTMQNAAAQITSQVEGIGNSFDAAGNRFGDMVASIVTGSRKASDVLKQLGSQLISSGISGLASSLFKGSGLGDIFAGFLDGGGPVKAGQFAIAGERGPEIVSGPARVTSRADTARMMGGGGQSGGTTTIRLIAPEGFTAQQEGQARGIAVQVVQEASPGIVRRSVGATYERAKEVALP